MTTGDEKSRERKKPLITNVTGPLASLSARVAFESFRPKWVAPKPVRLVWAGLDVPLDDAAVLLHEEVLTLRIKETFARSQKFFERFTTINEPGTIFLENGTSIATPHADPASIGETFDLEFPHWEWLPGSTDSLVFVSEIGGVTRLPSDNLEVHGTKDGEYSGAHLHLDGYFTWHILRPRGSARKPPTVTEEETPHAVALAVARLGSPGLVAARGDLMALDYTFGQELDVRVLWAVNSEGEVVGGIGTGRHAPTTHGSRTPFPSAPGTRECWAAPLFRRVAEALARDEGNGVGISMPVTGYMDGGRGHIHGGYLLGQVALEAFCKAVAPKADQNLLVTSSDSWVKWINRHASEIRAFAADDESATMLLNKLQGNAIQRPFGEVVERAFRAWGVKLPVVVLKEIKKRNRAAHDFVMFDEVKGDIQEAADRLDMIQMLLAGAVALHVGYDGPIVGWERESSGHLRVPNFWPSKRSDEAETVYLSRMERSDQKADEPKGPR